MNKILSVYVLFLSVFSILFVQSCSRKHTDTEISLRAPADTVGFAWNADALEAVIQKAEQAEMDSIESEKRMFDKPWSAGICPHDDHVYAGRVYVHLLRNIKAKHIVLFGVGHKAWKWGVKDKIILDSFTHWTGPYKPVPVMQEVRNELINGLDTSFYCISNAWHRQEHSIEGIVPFLQYYTKDVEILPIIVPYMHWSRIDSIAENLARIFSNIIDDRSWTPGKDIAFIISTDCVHYGDEGWGGKNYAPFGADEQGYIRAVKREFSLIHEHLTGNLEQEKLSSFLYKLVDKDLYTYRITWCGRFCIPMGLDVLFHLNRIRTGSPISGTLLRYGTSYDLGVLDTGMDTPGTTAPRSIRHWVGYCAIGYR